MMKKFFIFTILCFMFGELISTPANANILEEIQIGSAQRKELKATEKLIKESFNLQSKYSNAKEFEKLKDFYAENYRNSDAFDKNTTFKIIKENYELYPELKMATKINNININGNFATVDVFEYAKCDKVKREDIELDGELEAFAHTIYYMEKIQDKWLITAEHALEETNNIEFGEARYLDLKLVAPFIVPAGESYTASLKVNNLPARALLMGSVSQTPAVFPLEENTTESLRVLEDLELERIFIANNKNINEYNVASIGITRAQPIPTGGTKLYMSGLAFLMTRVNVIPENKFYEKAVVEESHD